MPSKLPTTHRLDPSLFPLFSSLQQFASGLSQAGPHRLFVALLIVVTTSSEVAAQETFSYRANNGANGNVSGTAETFHEAYRKIQLELGDSDARFVLDTADVYGGARYKYTSTPYKYAFWNISGFNGMGANSPNAPASSPAKAISSALALGAENKSKDPRGNGIFVSMVLTGGFAKDSSAWQVGWKYSAPLTVLFDANVVGPKPYADKMFGAVAYAEIIRNIPPACSCDMLVGNPIDAANGAKTAVETDFADAGLLTFSRAYNSQMPSFPGGMGGKGSWQHSFERVLASDTTFFYNAAAFRFDSALHPFTASGPSYPFVAGTSNPLRLFRETDNAVGSTLRLFVPADNSSELYDAKGVLLAIKRADDQVLLTYSGAVAQSRYPSSAPACAAAAVSTLPGQLLCVTNRFGRQLNFAYDAGGRLRKMFDPAGLQYSYDFDAWNNLTQVTFPDSYRRVFHYNEPENTGNTHLPNALTGISVEPTAGNFARYSTYQYDSRGFAISTELAGGVNKFTVAYDLLNKRRSVGTPTGSSREFQMDRRNYSFISTGETRIGAGVATAATSNIYDANGNLKESTGFNGTITQYTYDLSRNLETKRVEGLGTPDARTISTEWHPSLRLVTRIAQPKRIVTNAYDAAGNLLSRKTQSTSDLNGAQGFSAGLVGTSRMTTYEYNAANQVSKITGPRIDLAEVTQFAYDAQGNMVSITNPAGHQTLLSDYDSYGRAGRITDPNGLATEITYTPRGKLASSTTGTEQTLYTYDGAGQLWQTSRTGGPTVTYSYDPAGRLTGVADNLGNTVTYTLDLAGNRTAEVTKDPGGVLTRQITRAYDVLNRLKQITGAQQ